MTSRAGLKLLLPMLVLLLAGAAYYSLVSSKTQRDRPVLSEKVWQIQVIPAERRSLSPSVTLYGRVSRLNY